MTLVADVYKRQSQGCYSAAWLEVRPALLGKSSKKIPSNKWRNHRSCFRYHIRLDVYKRQVERPILIISMVEDVKGRGGSGYVVKKDNRVLEEWFGSN